MSESARSPASARRAGPVEGRERFVSLDLLRGVAILGILVMNIYAFAMPFVAYMNPLRMGGTEPWNIGTWIFTHVLFDQKFISIFAMMFGAGIVLMSGRAESGGNKPAGFYYRRQLWLVVIGAIHAYLIWVGDVLFMYALIGMLAYLFRKRTPRTLIIVACCLLPFTVLFNYGNVYQTAKMMGMAAEVETLVEQGEELDDEQRQLLDDWADMRAFMMPTDEDIALEVEVYRGDYAGIVQYRAPIVVMMHLFFVFGYGLFRVGGLMLLGMAMMKLGVFTAQRSVGFYKRLMLGGYLLGLPLTVFSAIDLHARDFEPLYAMSTGSLANYFGSILVALGHIGLVMLVAKSGVLAGLMSRFAAVGRMALTNYLMHSVVLTTVFYGYGLGLFGSVPRLWQMAFVAVVIGFQLWFSTWWLERYRFGPVEWLWRTVTYWRSQPMRQPAR
ncbi:MAG: DUF418 domain-containing protein [Woeseiaceae bacterium]|nr:DUF418 domain-containing protein [Woeseiaceae bacterium]